VPSRWAYEAIIVSHFKDNKYNRYFFAQQFKCYQNHLYNGKVIPLLEKSLSASNSMIGNKDSLVNQQRHLSILRREFRLLGEREEIAPFENIDFLNHEDFDEAVSESVSGYLTYLKFRIEKRILKGLYIQSLQKRLYPEITCLIQKADYYFQ
jgi:hypothetical protein